MNKESNGDEIKKMIQDSGNLFHSEVICHFRNENSKNEWFITVSPYYSDNVTRKSREIDIIAENYRHGNSHALKIKLFIECKKFTKKESNKSLVFWFDEIDDKNAFKLAKGHMSIFEDHNTNVRNHHYLSGDKTVAKFFDSFSDKKEENEPFYNALNQSLNAFIYFRNRESFSEDCAYDEKVIREQSLKKLYLNYPLIVLSDFNNLHRVDIDNKSECVSLKEEASFLFEVNYSYLDEERNSKCEYFLIDVVNFKKIDNFIKDKLENHEIKHLKKYNSF